MMKAAKADTPIVELQQLSEWLPEVMTAETPVIVDCYAEWCAPCKKLDPKLTEKVLSYDGKLKLVKLNIDNLP